jgi:hypothetical protein
VAFDAKPVKTETRDHWNVVLEYEMENETHGKGPFVVDLSHCHRWDVQDGDVGHLRPEGAAIPGVPGACQLSGTVLINRMNRTQAAVWHLSGQPVDLPPERAYTETTETTLCMALFGPRVFEVTERLTNLDLRDPGREVPFLLQGPLSHVPCQVAVLSRADDPADNRSGLIFTCSRGYGKDMTRAVSHAGRWSGLKPAGENAFTDWLNSISG